MLESGVRYDFDAAAYSIVGNSSQIITGFDVIGGYGSGPGYTSYYGVSPSKIQINVNGARIIHPLATESGSFFAVSTTRTYEILGTNNSSTPNPKVTGNFTSNSTNFVGIDLLKSADSTTADVVQLLNMSTDTEVATKMPLSRTLDYQFYISTTDFSYSPNIAPVCIVKTDNQGNVVYVVDARSLLGRLTPGGTINNNVVSNAIVPYVAPYGWPGGRDETTGASNAGDKSITSMKQWQNAIMTRLWELGGGQYWYSLTADRNVKMIQGSSTFVSTGEAFEYVAGPNLHWQGISFIFDNSPQYVQAVADQTTNDTGPNTITQLNPGQCIYVDIKRTSATPVVAQKGNLVSLGGSAIPGQRYVIAANIGGNFYVRDQSFPVGHSFQVATTTVAGAIKTNIDFTATTPIAATIAQSGASSGFVTGLGLSHNLDVGIAHGIPTNPSDITIGRLSGAGDQNIKLQVDGNYGVSVTAYGGSTQPYLSVSDTFSHGSQRSDTVLNLSGGHINSGYGADGSWSTTNLSALPSPPTSGTVKHFARATKVWLNPVKAVIFAPSPTWVIDGTKQILTCSSTGVLTTDGVSTWAAGTDRVLVNIPSFPYNGAYIITNSGGIGVNAVLTRSGDSNAQYNLFDGITFPVTNGTVYGNTNMVLNCPTNYNSANIDGSTFLIWTPTNNYTYDEFCIMFSDGSYHSIATSTTANTSKGY